MPTSQKSRKKGLSDLESMTKLGSNYRPTDFDVICARGKGPKNHNGNRLFRQLIVQSTPAYASANSRLQKSLVVSSVVDCVREASPTGGFVKEINGIWYEVGDHLAREKVGQSLREQLHSQYKSSAKSKRARKRQQAHQTVMEVQQTNTILDSIIPSDPKINQCVKNVQLQADVLNVPGASEDSFLRLFDQNNVNILQTISNDVHLKQGISQLFAFCGV